MIEGREERFQYGDNFVTCAITPLFEQGVGAWLPRLWYLSWTSSLVVLARSAGASAHGIRAEGCETQFFLMVNIQNG